MRLSSLATLCCSLFAIAHAFVAPPISNKVKLATVEVSYLETYEADPPSGSNPPSLRKVQYSAAIFKVKFTDTLLYHNTLLSQIGDFECEGCEPYHKLQGIAQLRCNETIIPVSEIKTGMIPLPPSEEPFAAYWGVTGASGQNWPPQLSHPYHFRSDVFAAALIFSGDSVDLHTGEQNHIEFHSIPNVSSAHDIAQQCVMEFLTLDLKDRHGIPVVGAVPLHAHTPLCVVADFIDISSVVLDYAQRIGKFTELANYWGTEASTLASYFFQAPGCFPSGGNGAPGNTNANAKREQRSAVQQPAQNLFGKRNNNNNNNKRGEGAPTPTDGSDSTEDDTPSTDDKGGYTWTNIIYFGNENNETTTSEGPGVFSLPGVFIRNPLTWYADAMGLGQSADVLTVFQSLSTWRGCRDLQDHLAENCHGDNCAAIDVSGLKGQARVVRDPED